MAEADTFGRWLRHIRRVYDLTQEQLADLIGFSPETIRKIEAGRRRPSNQVVDLLAHEFDVPEEHWPALLRLARGRSELEEPHRPNLPDPQPTEAASVSLVPPPERTNIRLSPTSFIGREKERAQVGEMLMRAGVRLITLTGPPGIGKTRLSFQVAHDLLDAPEGTPYFRDGAFWVPLSPVRDPSLVPRAITRVLKVDEVANLGRMDLLKNYLHTKQMLLVLDNFEQVLAAAPLVAELLEACPHLKVIASSREGLNVYGEQQFLLPPLSMPDPEEHPDLQAIGRCEAIELFVRRSQSVNPDFELTEASTPVVSEICRQLDGLPLAIELAAARSKVLPPQAIRERLGNKLKLLTAGAQDLPPRQRTLRGAIDWSYDLLGDKDRLLFRRISVFVGATLDSVQGVCRLPGEPAGALDALEGVSSLLSKSLLRRVDDQGDEGNTRFYMLWTIREYALEKLAESGEEQAVRRQHAVYFLRLAEVAEPHLTSGDRASWLAQLESEWNNIQAALEWCLSEGGDHEMGLRLARALRCYWHVRGRMNEGREWLERALERTGRFKRSAAGAKAPSVPREGCRGSRTTRRSCRLRLRR